MTHGAKRPGTVKDVTRAKTKFSVNQWLHLCFFFKILEILQRHTSIQRQQIRFINLKKSFLFSPRFNINILRFVNKDWSRDQQGQVIVQVNIEEFASINFGYCPALRRGRLLKEPWFWERKKCQRIIL
jgi:hypothetical protein